MQPSKKQHQMSSETIEKFCFEFFKDLKCDNLASHCSRICIRLTKNKTLQSIDLNALNIGSVNNLNIALQQICETLFKVGKKDEYVLSILAFTILLDAHLEKEEWYNNEILITSLVNVLEKIDFKPQTFQRNVNTVDRVIGAALIILPAVLAFFNFQ